MSEELNPCPFCQSRAEHYSFSYRKHTVRCRYCLADCGEHDHPERAAFVWNTRPAEEDLKAEITRYRRALYNLKEDCTRRKHFAVSDEEKLFLYETISHIDAELDFNTDTEKGGKEQ